ncbi:Na+/H+ antiporter subunit C [Thermaurantiacus tibetensis]|uniref:Na+/H+ antiporter subunit C n=1 Tax=Thermaurantiacus tibetensis TaxID=2759035 RepID=UPI00188ED8DC|nr:Na+/H+ antiporter subunit C [Thermaurantiacus tibetensis]
MELLLALGIGLLVGCGVWLALASRTFPVILGLTLIGYAVNLLIFFGGRIGASAPPLALPGATGLADPLPQALVLTAIVIGFGMTAYFVALALKGIGESGVDAVDLPASRDDTGEEP